MAAPGLQTKLRIAAVDDPAEAEADRIADAVVLGRPIGPIDRATSGIAQRKCAECEAEEEKTVQRKETAAAPAGRVPQHAVDAAANAVSHGGEPLSPKQRAYFEPRFGRDFSDVRVHTHREAASAAHDINARAFTLGSDIAFALGEYDPRTQDGARLLAHELAHVEQQGQGTPIRRKIRTDPRAPIDTYLRKQGVVGFVSTGMVYEALKGGARTFEQELLIDMLASPRLFEVDGDSQADAEKSLSAHLTARKGVVTFAGKKQYTFASVTGFKMNPAYYNVHFTTNAWSMKKGVDKQTAWDDLNVNPQLYAIGCSAATDLTLAGGSKGAKIEDKPSADDSDWIAGEAGYVENTMFRQGANIGLLGENIIYTGSGQFWGHFSGNVTYRTLADWKSEVASWHGGGAAAASKVDTKRELPMTGLL